MKIKKIDLNGFITIIPYQFGSNTKSHKISYRRVLGILITYTFIAAFLGFIVFNLTPVKGIFFSKGSLSRGELKTIDQLNEKMNYLSRELDDLRNNNEKLKNALKLGDSSLFENETSVKKIKSRSGGSILAVFKELFYKLKIVQKDNINFIKPVSGYISRYFDPERGHMGVDFVVKTGTPVYVSANGFIIFANYTVKDGNMIIISHPGNYITIYKHCSTLLKKERDLVFQGEMIALSGNTGEITTGPHLHFEIWKDGIPINPITILLNL